MKKISTVMLVLVLALSISVIADQRLIKDKYWNKISHADKFSLKIEDYSGSLKLSIIGIEATKTNLLHTGMSEDLASATFNLAEKRLRTNRLWLICGEAVNGSSYFLPTDFSFVQNFSQWNIESYGDIMSVSETFSGDLKPGATATGFIAVPDGLNLDEKYTVWYGDHKKTVESN